MNMEILGYIGMVDLLIGLALTRTDKKVHSDVFSIFGGFLMCIYGILMIAYPVTILNFIWVLIGINNLRKTLKEFGKKQE